MKLHFIAFLLLFVIATSTFSRKVKRSRKHMSRYKHFTAHHHHSKNIFYQFMLGVIAEFSGQPNMVDLCLNQVPGWQLVGTVEEDKSKDEKSNESVVSSMKEQGPTWKKILGYLGTAINVVCTIKDKIIDFFSKKRLRYHRLMLQGKIRRRFRWSVSGFISSASNAIKSAGDALVSGANKVASAVVDGVDWATKKASEVYTFIKEKLKEKIQPILDLLEDMKSKFKSFIHHQFVHRVVDFLKCFLTSGGLKGTKQVEKGIISLLELIPKLATPTGWVQLSVNLVCGWETLKDGIYQLEEALKEETITKRYNLFGKFFGHVIRAIAGN